jgi:hypothetical protein
MAASERICASVALVQIHRASFLSIRKPCEILAAMPATDTSSDATE